MNTRVPELNRLSFGSKNKEAKKPSDSFELPIAGLHSKGEKYAARFADSTARFVKLSKYIQYQF